MPEFIIGGVSVKFPFTPYEVQRHYMEKVIESLNNKENAVLESPTGTGKTLSLLCATLGWIEQRKKTKPNTACICEDKKNEKDGHSVSCNDEQDSGLDSPKKSNLAHIKRADEYQVPKVIYASRTHSQLKQAMNELKRTEYNYMKAAVVASRDQLCNHPDLKDKPNADKISMCEAMRKAKEKKKQCEYHLNFKKNGSKISELKDHSILDIEELGRIGENHGCCSYYLSKDLVDGADIVFMPYNYIIDPQIRGSHNLSNAIVILDEAHNVEKVCEDSASTCLKSSQIETAIGNLDHAIAQNSKIPSDAKFKIEDILDLRKSVLALDRQLTEISLQTGAVTHPGSFIFSLLDEADINQAYIGLINRIISFLIDLTKKNRKYVTGIRAIKNFLHVAYSTSSPALRDSVDKCYKVYIEAEPAPAPARTASPRNVQTYSNGKIVNFWCFSAKFGMQHLVGNQIHSLIMTSGTLAPLEPLVSEMEVSFPVQLTNPHIIDPSQIDVTVVDAGPDQVKLNSSYLKRDREEYITSLGQSIFELAKVIPDGLLVFFPSYGLMDKYITAWRKRKNFGATIWEQMNTEASLRGIKEKR